jgi:hypothetical protein
MQFNVIINVSVLLVSDTNTYANTSFVYNILIIILLVPNKHPISSTQYLVESY